MHPPVSQALVVVSNYNEDIDIPSVPLKEKVVAVSSVPVKRKIVDTDAVSPVPLNQTPSKLIIYSILEHELHDCMPYMVVKSENQ